MKKSDLNSLYKEFYFHELDVREKVTNRLQLTFAFHATVLTIVAYMMRTLDTDVLTVLLYTFYALVLSSLIPFAISIGYTVRAFWGNTYKGVATPLEIENFRKKSEAYETTIRKYNSEKADKDRVDYCAREALSDYLYDEYAKCTSHNIDVNAYRGECMHSAIKLLLFTAVPLILASSVFVIGDMDGSSPRKEVLMKHTSPLVVVGEVEAHTSSLPAKKEQCMSEQETNQGQQNNPPPPEPPETRNIIQSDPPTVTLDQEKSRGG